jgi:hypothetical protein
LGHVHAKGAFGKQASGRAAAQSLVSVSSFLAMVYWLFLSCMPGVLKIDSKAQFLGNLNRLLCLLQATRPSRKPSMGIWEAPALLLTFQVGVRASIAFLWQVDVEKDGKAMHNPA